MTKENMSNKEIDDFISRLEAQKQPTEKEDSVEQTCKEAYNVPLSYLKSEMAKAGMAILKHKCHKPSILKELFPEMGDKEKVRIQAYVDSVVLLGEALELTEGAISGSGSITDAEKALKN